MTETFNIQVELNEATIDSIFKEAYSECYKWLKENMYYDEEGICQRFYEHFFDGDVKDD